MTRFVVAERIGVGGMGEVFAARQEGASGFARPVALKKLARSLSADREFADLFMAEARLASQLNHPNIVSVYAFDRDEDGALFLAMELVDGMDLRWLVLALRERNLRMDVALAGFIAGEILKALDHAHELRVDGRPLGLVHRDVSPHNVLLSARGAVKLSDFGIAKATEATPNTGTVRGKIPYMAPEQALGEPLDRRTDLFGVGVIFYEMLAGQRPFGGETDVEILGQLLHRHPEPLRQVSPEVPRDLAALIARLLAKDPAKRFATAAEAFAALVEAGGYDPDGDRRVAELVTAVKGGVAPGLPSMGVRKRRSRLLSIAIAASVALGSSAIAWFAVPRTPPPAPPWASEMPEMPEARVLEWVHTPGPRDPLASLPRALEIARRVKPDAEFIGFMAEDVGADGLIGAGRVGGRFAFRTSFPAESRLCALTVDFGPEAVGIRTLTTPVCAMKPVPVPRCSLADIWRRSMGGRPAQSASGLDVMYRWSEKDQRTEWLVRNLETATLLSDDCSALP